MPLGESTTQRRARVKVPRRRHLIWSILAAGLAMLGVGGLVFVGVQRWRPGTGGREVHPSGPVASSGPAASGPSALPAASGPSRPSPLPPGGHPLQTPATGPSGPTTAQPPRLPPNAPQPLQVVTNPPGATVVLDNDPTKTCQSPCSFQVPPGRHVLASNLAGYREALRIVEVSRQPREEFVDMVRMMGTVMVMADALGAQILIDGKPVPETTPARLNLAAGKHVVSVVKDGHRTDQEIEVKDGSVLKYTLQLNP